MDSWDSLSLWGWGRWFIYLLLSFVINAQLSFTHKNCVINGSIRKEFIEHLHSGALRQSNLCDAPFKSWSKKAKIPLTQQAAPNPCDKTQYRPSRCCPLMVPLPASPLQTRHLHTKVLTVDSTDHCHLTCAVFELEWKQHYVNTNRTMKNETVCSKAPSVHQHIWKWPKKWHH